MIEGIVIGVVLTLLVFGTHIVYKKFTGVDADKWDGYWMGLYVLTWWNIVLDIAGKLI